MQVADMANEDTWACPSCTASNAGKFCGSCGEKKPDRHDLSLGHLLSHAGETLFHWDSKLLATFRTLLLRPGQLSEAYIQGCRKPYVHPFQVFFIANVLYFLLFPVLGWTGLKTPLNVHETMLPYSSWAARKVQARAAAKGISHEELAHRFDHIMDVQSRSMVLLMVPLFAFVLFVAEFYRRRFLAEHLVFALHFMAVWLLFQMILLPIVTSLGARFFIAHGIRISARGLDRFTFETGGILLATYLFFGLRRFYRDSLRAAVIKAPLLAYASLYVLAVYRFLLFLTVLYST
jgi:hypothetical protein